MKSLTDLLHGQVSAAIPQRDGSVQIAVVGEPEMQKRLVGRDWPAFGETMVGLRRLENVRRCMEEVLRDGVPGDFIETGVWRGGTTILMRGILACHGVTDRQVWVADSFQGLPSPSPEQYPADRGDRHSTYTFLVVPLEQVKENFSRYGLLDDRVRFLQGWFKDTLPTVRDRRWAVIRLDGDMYESTMDALTNLYDNLSPGGFAIIDDYGCVPACKQAVDDFRAARGITDPIDTIDWTGVYWRKSAGR